MIHTPSLISLLGLFGTQEVIILLIIGIPICLGIWLFRFILRNNKQLKRLAKTGTAVELEKLFALKQKGAISEEEYNRQKAALLQ